MIVLNNITKEFSSGDVKFHALKGVSLNVPAGCIFGIIGRSGAGKSTLIRTINLLERPTTGCIRVDGVEMTSLTPEKLRQMRKKIGMIFQSFNLFSARTVAENIAFPLELEGRSKETICSRVDELLDLVGLWEKRNDYPAQLSGGQKQRIGIARALACQPKILLCDEATSALDPQTTRSILALLKEINLKLGLTVLLITHEMEVIKEICSDVAVMDSGKVVESGAVFEVFTRPKTETTQELVDGVMGRDLPSHFADMDFVSEPLQDSTLLLRVSFLGDTAAEPVISGMIRRCGIDVNILYGSIDHIQGVPYGTLVVELSGSGDDRNAALDYLRNLNLGVEVIGYVCRNQCHAV